MPVSELSTDVQEMFERIAPRYDLMNRIMTAGQDLRWRKDAIRRLRLPSGGVLLDIGAGTGDLAREALRQQPNCRPVAVDFALEMMRFGQAHSPPVISWAAADALLLPFPENTFDAVASSFLLRNVSDLSKSLAEQYRVLKPGGRVVALDTTPPAPSLLTPLIRFHLHTIIPTLGRFIAGQPQAYRYLPDSTEHFLDPDQLVGFFLEAGFMQVAYRRMMFGAVAIHWAAK